MDATLFDTRLRQTRATCYPEASDTFSWGFATTLAYGQVRAAGLYGSQLFYAGKWSIGGQTGISAFVQVELPPGYFGTIRPPMIYAQAQFGSRVLYKTMRDANSVFTGDSQAYAGLLPTAPPEYHVSIINLKPWATTIGGVEYNVWRFTINLHAYHSTGRTRKPGFHGVWKYQSYPTFDDHVWFLQGLESKKNAATPQGVMHWYAVGVDAW